MIALEVRLNGKRVCIAGADDLCVLNAIVNAVGELGAKTVPIGKPDRDLFFSVGGLTRRPDPKKDVHLRWKSSSRLRVGDVVEIKVLEVKKADRAKSRSKAER